MVDPCLAAALSVQLAEWRAALAGGAQRVGWKLGMGDRERIGDGPVIGHLTTASRLADGARQLADRGALHADAEVALEIGRDRLIVDGEMRASAPAATDYADRVLIVACLLAAMGERLIAGDRIITGSIVQVPVDPGAEVVADLGLLGRPRATLAA